MKITLALPPCFYCLRACPNCPTLPTYRRRRIAKAGIYILKANWPHLVPDELAPRPWPPGLGEG